MITFRRYYLDKFLSKTRFHGKVLDIGGKKENKRGQFRPPLDKVETWEYLNIDETTNPDYLCSAESIPVKDETFDAVLMTEVLEHLEHPEIVLAEAYRVLKKKGVLIATMPFLYPVHADPYDFQRWTSQKLESVFEKAGFKIEHIEPMGGFFAVLYDLAYISLGIASKNRRALKNRIIIRFAMPVLAKIFMRLDEKYIYKKKIITTGYCIVGSTKKWF